jgi:hypothetical protein
VVSSPARVHHRAIFIGYLSSVIGYRIGDLLLAIAIGDW